MKSRLALSAIGALALASCGSPAGGGAGTEGSGGAGETGGGGATGGGGSTGNGGSTGAGGAAGADAGRGGAGGAAVDAGRGGAGGAAVDAGRGGAGGAAVDAGRGGAGGAGTGGTGGDWLAGYTATMFGNTGMGDCNAVPNFSDMTNISGATCTHQGVTIAAYSSTTANNASYYGAPGDLSSIWMGPTCKCQNGDTETNGHCARAPSCNMEGDCSRCFEIKCDPNGTGMYSDGATRRGANYCNANQSVVIEVIDACPHNHPSNTWWCTNSRVNHIDISCSAMRAIAGNPANVGSWGWLNVQVRPVDCSVGLGAKTQ